MESGSIIHQALAHQALGWVASSRGELDTARVHLQTALAMLGARLRTVTVESGLAAGVTAADEAGVAADRTLWIPGSSVLE